MIPCIYDHVLIQVDGYDSEEERRLEEEKAAKRRVHAKVVSRRQYLHLLYEASNKP